MFKNTLVAKTKYYTVIWRVNTTSTRWSTARIVTTPTHNFSVDTVRYGIALVT